MNNLEEFTTPPLDTPISELKESLRSIVHTIIFNRAMGGSRAIDALTVQAPVFDLAYAKVRDDSGEIDSVIEDRIKAFADIVSSSTMAGGGGGGSLHFVLSFYTEKPKERSLLWQVISGVAKEKIYFERWRIPVQLLSSRPSSPSHQEVGASRSVNNVLWFVLRKLSEKMEHLPGTCATLVYPFDVIFEKSKTGETAAWSPRSIASSIKSIPYIT